MDKYRRIRNKFEKMKIKGSYVWEKVSPRRQASRFERKVEEVNPLLSKPVKIINDLCDTVDNVYERNIGSKFKEDESPEGWDFVLADHLYVNRIGYSHHAIYVGNGHVLHYSDFVIKEATLLEFSKGEKIYKKSEWDSPLLHDVNYAVWRGYKRIDEGKYNLVFNNCENFVRWCRAGSGNY